MSSIDPTRSTANTTGGFGKTVLGGLKKAASFAASTVPGLSTALNTAGIPTDLADNFDRQYQLIELQNKIQSEMQTINMISNIYKTKHEADMNSIRNMK